MRRGVSGEGNVVIFTALSDMLMGGFTGRTLVKSLLT